MRISKEKLSTVAKLIVGAGLTAYVVHSRMVDFRVLHTILFNPWALVTSLLFMAFSAAACAKRWHFLVRAQGLSLSFGKLVELTMIGNFFNTIMPGAVGGDLIKAWYVAGQEPQRKPVAVLTVLLDRVIGLSVILFYAAVALLFCGPWLREHPQLRVLAGFLWAFTGGCLLAGLVFFSPLRKFRGFQWVLERCRRYDKLAQLLDAALLYRHHLRPMLAALALSSFSTLSITVLFWLQGRAMGIPMNALAYFFAVPVAQVVSAVPLLPGGIGAGQVAFYTLFLWIGVPNPEQGGSLCTLMQVYVILFNCTGAFFYLKIKRHPRAFPSAPAARHQLI